MKLKTIILLVGDSGCGKTTFQKIAKQKHGIPWILSSTTRQPRAGEVNNVDYRFVTLDQYQQELDREIVVQHLTYGVNTYFTSIIQYEQIDAEFATIAVLGNQIEPIQKYFAENGIDMNYKIVLFNISAKKIIENLGGITNVSIEDMTRINRGSITSDFIELAKNDESLTPDHIVSEDGYYEATRESLAEHILTQIGVNRCID